MEQAVAANHQIGFRKIRRCEIEMQKFYATVRVLGGIGFNKRRNNIGADVANLSAFQQDVSHPIEISAWRIEHAAN
jgi:hypothetical protein